MQEKFTIREYAPYAPNIWPHFSYSYIIKVLGNKKDMAGETRRSWNYEMFGGSPRRNSQQGGETSHRHTSWLGWASKTEKPNPGMIMVSFYDLLRFYRIKAFFLVSGLSTLPICSHPVQKGQHPWRQPRLESLWRSSRNFGRTSSLSKCQKAKKTRRKGWNSKPFMDPDASDTWSSKGLNKNPAVITVPPSYKLVYNPH